MKLVKEIECRIGELGLVDQDFVVRLINHLASLSEDNRQNLIQGIIKAKKERVSNE